MGRRTMTAPDFTVFWGCYGLTRNRKDAERAWERLTPADRQAACSGISAYREECRRRGVGMRYAQSYLSHRCWEDVHGAAPGRRRGTAAALPYEMETW